MKRDLFSVASFFMNELGPSNEQGLFGVESKGEDNEKDYTLYLSVPGFKKEDIEIVGKDNELTIHGKENTDRVFVRKGFYKKYTVGNRYDLNKIEASLVDGVLKLVIPLLKGKESIKIAVK